MKHGPYQIIPFPVAQVGPTHTTCLALWCLGPRESPPQSTSNHGHMLYGWPVTCSGKSVRDSMMSGHSAQGLAVYQCPCPQLVKSYLLQLTAGFSFEKKNRISATRSVIAVAVAETVALGKAHTSSEGCSGLTRWVSSGKYPSFYCDNISSFQRLLRDRPFQSNRKHNKNERKQGNKKCVVFFQI